MATAARQAHKVDIHDIASRLWETADELRANSHLKAAAYSIPVLGLIFLSSQTAALRISSSSSPASRRGAGRSGRPTTRVVESSTSLSTPVSTGSFS